MTDNTPTPKTSPLGGAARTVVGDAKGILGAAAAGAAQGAVVGGGLPGAAVGAGKGLLVGAAKSRTFWVVVGSIVGLVALIGVAAVSQVLSILTLAATSISATDTRTSYDSAIGSGATLQNVEEAMDLVAGTGIPWEIAASTFLEVGEPLDVKAAVKALDVHDPRARYRSLGAGSTYSSGTAERTVTDPSASAVVERLWILVLNDVVAEGEESSAAIFQQALTWHLGQSFGACSLVLGNGGDGTQQELDAEQLANVATILGVAKGSFEDAGMQRQAAIIAVTTALQESSLRNLEGGDLDSLGLFQQRPSAGWGTEAQIMDPVYSSSKFYVAMSEVENWQTSVVGDVAQAVQISAFPDEYAKWENTARVAVAKLFADTAPIDPAVGGVVAPVEGEGVAEGVVLCLGGNLIVDGNTVSPVVNYVITSRFGPRASPTPGGSTNHKGIDLARAGCEATPPILEPIYSVQAGTVTRAESWGAYGNMIEVDHGNGLVTRYAHLLGGTTVVNRGDAVVVGEALALMGSTGASTGCHLHFETMVDGKAENPEIVMLRLGVLL